MSLFHFIIIIVVAGIVAGTPAIVRFYFYIEDFVLKKRWERDFKNSTWCCCKGDFVRSKECGGECETCKHFVTLEDLK